MSTRSLKIHVKTATWENLIQFFHYQLTCAICRFLIVNCLSILAAPEFLKGVEIHVVKLNLNVEIVSENSSKKWLNYETF
jgi:hypothetical protein